MSACLRLGSVCVVLLCGTSLLRSADEKPAGTKRAQLQAADKNNDGALTSDELGEQAWRRVAAFDANSDGKLDSQELAVLGSVKSTDRKTQVRPGGAGAAFTIHEFRGTNGETIRYSLFRPAAEVKNPPLVLCLHGVGGNTAAANILASAAMQKKHPCIVVAPACDGRSERWVKSSFRGQDKQRAVMPELMEMLDAVIKETGADPRRIYLTGQSMGGVGTWGLLAAHSEKFAAAVPVCGYWLAEDAAKMAAVPVWTFHGAKDQTVPIDGTRNMVAALKAAGASPKYTEYPDVAHGSWESAYASAELWDWLFEQRRK